MRQNYSAFRIRVATGLSVINSEKLKEFET